MSLNIILASTSPYRLQLLQDIGLQVQAEGALVDEKSIVADSPVNTAIARAKAKAMDVYSRFPNSLVIGADQVCYLQEDIMGKPESEEQWLYRLQQMREEPHYLSTAVVLCYPSAIANSVQREEHNEDFCCFVETTKVYFRGDLSDDVLRQYVKIGEAKNCAGGYMMEKQGAWLIEKIEGDWQNVIGLPIFPLTKHLRALGIPFFHRYA